MKKLFKVFCFLGLLLVVASCRKEANISRSFTVTVQNVSTPGLLNTLRAGVAVPLSPGSWAIFTENDPMFTEGKTTESRTTYLSD